MASAMSAIAAPASQLFNTNTLHGSSGSSATHLQLRSKLGARLTSIPIPIRGLGCGGLCAMTSRGGRNKGWHHEQLVRCKSPEVQQDEEEGFEMPANALKIEGVEQLVGGGNRGVEKIFSNVNQATLKHEPGRFCCYVIHAIFVTGNQWVHLWEFLRVASTCAIHVKFHTEFYIMKLVSTGDVTCQWMMFTLWVRAATYIQSCALDPWSSQFAKNSFRVMKRYSQKFYQASECDSNVVLWCEFWIVF